MLYGSSVYGLWGRTGWPAHCRLPVCLCCPRVKCSSIATPAALSTPSLTLQPQPQPATLPPPPSQNLQALDPNENLIEVLVSEAVLNPAAELAPDASTFVAWDFFLHDSQATPVLPGSSPSYKCTVRQGCCTVLGTVG